MSQIFDAIRRSEAERSGSGMPALSEATKLLQRAERQAASKWESSVLVEAPDATESTEGDTPLKLEEVARTAPAVESFEEDGPAATGELSSVFSELQSLQISPPNPSKLACVADKESAAAEAFRLLGVRLRHLRRDRPLKKVLITSTIPQEGKSMIAANLACTLALRTHQRILLLEGDVRRPSLSRLFGLGKNEGLCEWLQGERSLTKSIYHLEGAGLWMLPAGSAPSNALELLQSERLSSLMAELTSMFDWILIDSPPVLPMADTIVWTRLADGILLVARQGTTEKRQFQRGVEALEQNKLLGAVLNCSNSSAYSDYYYRPNALSQQSGSLTRND